MELKLVMMAVGLVVVLGLTARVEGQGLCTCDLRVHAKPIVTQNDCEVRKSSRKIGIYKRTGSLNVANLSTPSFPY
jgi:hypothetical protein